MNRNYIIFFWILCLILFTFYCVFRLKYLSENTHKNINTRRILKETYFDPDPTGSPVVTPEDTYKAGVREYTGDVLVTRPEITKAPMITHVGDFMTYIKNIQAKDKITDMLECDTLYDDNLKVRELGYKNCGSAYSDYLEKNYDLNKKYGNSYTLAEICPIASKSPVYKQCLQKLLTKFTDGVNLVGSVNKDMTDSINTRLSNRTDTLYKVQASISPFIYSKVQNDFNKSMLMKKQIGIQTEDKLNLINKYYEDRYQVGMETFNNYSTDTIETFTNVTLTEIEKDFFGSYKPVRGQFQHLADLIFTIEYDDSGNNIKPNTDTDTSAIKVSSLVSSQGSSQDSSTQPTTLSDLSPLSVKANARPVIFTFKNDDIYITYTVSNIDFYKTITNAIKLMLTDKNIVYQASPNNTIEPLLKQLGLYVPSSINLVFDQYTSTEDIDHNTYRLVNDNLDTILVLEKIIEPKPKTLINLSNL